MTRRWLRRMAAVSVLVALLGFVNPSQAAADTPGHVTCPNVGDKVPLIFVHGLNSNGKTWDSMVDSVSDMKGIYIVPPFDYSEHNLEWVTNSEIGPKLAATIACYAKASTGKKVIVVAHSMGGLATELAAATPIGGKNVADYLGLVITIGTPYRGSVLGNIGTDLATSICNAPLAMLSPLLKDLVTKEQCLGVVAVKGLSVGSEELNQLPSFPSSVPVKTIAGDVTSHVWTPWADNAIDTNSDLVVAVDSNPVAFYPNFVRK